MARATPTLAITAGLLVSLTRADARDDENL